jgi:hypothetical protein
MSSRFILLAQSLDFSLKWQIIIILYQTGDSSSSNNLLLFDFDTELHTINDGMNTDKDMKKREKKDAELPLFSYNSVAAATNNFSATNKLGEGGFGPVYMVRLISLINVLCTLLRKPKINSKPSWNFKELMVLFHREIYLAGRKLQWRCFQKNLDKELRSSEMRQN